MNVAVGIGLREPYTDELLALEDRSALDVLELMIDEVLCPNEKRKRWRQLGAKWPLVAHGTELGIADAAGPDADYVAAIHKAARALRVRWYSEHLAFLRGGDIELGHFGPFFADDEGLAALSRNASIVTDGLPCPLLLENPADILGWTDGGYGRALEAAGCGALLDLTNLVYGCRNDGGSVEAFFDTLDWERVVEVHLAGGRQSGGLWIDTHDHPVDAEAMSLVGEAARRAPNLRAIIVERDDRLPPLASMLAEVEAVRRQLT